MRTDLEIVKQTEELARSLAEINGVFIKTPNYSFRNSENPRLKIYWALACESQRVLTNTDPNDCEDEYELIATLAKTLEEFKKLAQESGLELSEVISYGRQQNAF